VSGSGNRLVALVTGWQAVASSCYYAVFAATPFLRDAFGLSRFLVGVVVTAMTLGYTLLLFPSGAAVDAYGERPVFVGGLLGLGGGLLAVAFAPSLGALLPGAVVLGGAYATAMPATNRAIVAGIAPARRGFALGLKQVGVTVGSGAAALVVVNAAPAVGVWTDGMVALGAVAVAVAVGFALGYRGAPADGRLTWPDLGSLRANGPYVALVAAGVFLGGGLFTTVGYLTLYLTEAVETGAAVAGLGFAAMQLTASLGRVVAGGAADRLTDRLGWRPARSSATLLLGQVALGAVLLVVLGLTRVDSLALLTVGGVGATMLGYTGLYYSALSGLVGEAEVGAATAGGQTTLNVGALLVPPAFGALVDATSYRVAWTALAALVLVGVGLVAVVRLRLD
jgi:MFS family permease